MAEKRNKIKKSINSKQFLFLCFIFFVFVFLSSFVSAETSSDLIVSTFSSHQYPNAVHNDQPELIFDGATYQNYRWCDRFANSFIQLNFSIPVLVDEVEVILCSDYGNENLVVESFDGSSFEEVFSGGVVFYESETISADEYKTYKKDFSTFNLPEGEYTLEVELVSPDGTFVESSNFKIKAKLPIWKFLDYKKLILLVCILTIVVFLSVIIIRRKRLNVF